MTKDEFAAKLLQFHEKEEEIRKQRSAIRKQYIAENAPYNVGDKVKITTPASKWEPEEVNYGYIECVKCDDQGNFCPDLKACKKDGSEHKTAHLYVAWSLHPQVSVIQQ